MVVGEFDFGYGATNPGSSGRSSKAEARVNGDVAANSGFLKRCTDHGAWYRRAGSERQ